MNTTLLASKDDVIDVMLASFVVTLVLNEDEAALNDPDIQAAVKGEANAPEISDAI